MCTVPEVSTKKYLWVGWCGPNRHTLKIEGWIKVTINWLGTCEMGEVVHAPAAYISNY